jgi:hypothetical protein
MDNGIIIFTQFRINLNFFTHGKEIGRMFNMVKLEKKKKKINEVILEDKKHDVIVDDLTDENLDDLEFAVRTEKAYREYRRGHFKTMNAQKFLDELEKW